MTNLVGRTAEVTAVASALASVMEGAIALQVRAAAGMGKTALLNETAHLAREKDFLVLRGAGVESPSRLSYAALADLLDPVINDVSHALPAPLHEALEIAVLRRRAPEAEIDPHAVARATLTSLQLLARAHPVLVLLDDVHWLDPDTARVLAFLLPRLGAARVAVVLASRADGSRCAVDLEGALRSMPDKRGGLTIGLAALDLDQIGRLTAAEEERPLARGELKRVHEISAGNPLFALELARSLRRSEPGAEMRVPASLNEVIGRRIEKIPDGATAVLATLTLVPKPSRELVGAATGLTDADVDAALDVGMDSGVITESHGELAFVHPLIGVAISSAAPATALRAAHRRLAGVATDPEQRAWHLSHAINRPDPRTAAQIEEGAELARRRAAPDVAAHLGETALRLTPLRDTADLRRRHLATAYHHAAAGSLPAAIRHVDSALDLASDPEEVADLQWRRGMFHFLHGDLDAAVADLRLAQEGTAKHQLRDELTRRLATMLCWQGRMRDALDEYGEDLERISRSEGPAAAPALAIRTICCHVLGLPLPADPVEQVMRERARHPDLPAHDDPSIRLAAAILTRTDAASAATVLQSALDQADAQGDDLGIAWVGSRLAIAAACGGEWPRAREAARLGLLAAERLASPPALIYALAGAGAQAALAGDDAPALDAAKRLERYGSVMFAAPQAALIRGFVAWTDGELDDATRLFDEAEEHLSALGIVEPTVTFLRWYRADVLLDAGRLEEVKKQADRLLRLGADRDHPIALALGHRARGRLDLDPARFETALALQEAQGWRFDWALTRYHQGTVLRRLRSVREARRALTEAAEEFSRLNALSWRERCAAEISRLGGRTAHPRTLTPSESRVAELAVRGMTNQEIARELVISVSTVASHLSSAYAKLGTRSRTELARRLVGEAE